MMAARRGWLPLVLLLLATVGWVGAAKKVTTTKDVEAAERNKKAFQSLGISDSDLTRVGGGSEPSKEQMLNPGEEYITEIESESLAPEAHDMYAQALRFLERGRPQGVEAREAAFRLLAEAAEKGHKSAMKIMAYAHLFGDDARSSTEESRTLFTQLSKEGSPDAFLGLGFMHATGVGVARSSQAKALVYYSFAAQGGNPLAQMAMGYRYYAGVGVPSSCEEALSYYQKVAELVANSVKFSTGLSIQRLRLTDELEPTSSSSSSSSPMDNNLLEYYRFLADKGDVAAQLGLGQLFLSGGRGIEQNFDEANRYLTSAAESGNSAAYAYLGKMYLDGTGATPQDNVTAFHFFLKSAEKSNQIGQAGLGIMFLQGRGVKQDYAKAYRLFSLAAEQGWVDGQLYLGVMHYQGLGVARDMKAALKQFQLASQNGHVLAYYNLAHMHANGVGVVRSCTTAVEFYKNVAERGRWTERMMSAYAAYKEKRPNEAAMKYLFMAELGYEQAQTNFAYILDKDEARSLFPELRSEVLSRALHAWKRAAGQEYPMARVKLGDYYYYGLGTEPDYAEAAHHYKIAADRHLTAQAMFNLGYMHENGEGIAQDLYLAKRYYDSAIEHSPDAVVPASLALAKLAVVFVLSKMKESPLYEFAIGAQHWDLIVMAAASGLIVALLVVLLRRQPAANRHEHQD
ncbi:hypothetical protein PFISCL1PPCAC_816 [Pristionchus fissidentatus]|uniref:Sel-1 n=1 Tax=Pristionchus fissidentatus TaxID=1538716 RepID=A0AAV5UUX0_9BILA|nr:hypothetical protein PFISCL1PPCAC_816 [Pristionchus fissidentatus]